MPNKSQPPHEIHSDLLEQAQQVHQHLVDNLHEIYIMVVPDERGNPNPTVNLGVSAFKP